MKAIVCGGRNFKDAKLVDEVLGCLPITEIVEGGARGADRLVRLWADRNDVPVTTVDAAWHLHGRSAGPIRNRAMLAQNPDMVVAFPGGRGTADMVGAAKAAGVVVIRASIRAGHLLVTHSGKDGYLMPGCRVSAAHVQSIREALVERSR